MQSVGSFFSTVSKFYNEINPATLSGAIDVVVVEQANGDLACSPFHVRFGKLSILRPQEKVVEVTINGRVVDFPMKVGDAGEAFFVFETEQEVPEEFATSPLAGPSSPGDKVEDEIDFLDLAQEGSGSGDHPMDVMLHTDTGYVSAHSGHGSEFEEDEQEFPSPPPALRQNYASAVQFGYGTDHRRMQGEVSVEDMFEQSEHKITINGRHHFPHDIMENFQPVDSAGPFGEDANTHAHFGYQPSTPVVPSYGDGSNDNNTQSQFLSPHKDDVIMDMTGYKTDDSAETDLESDDGSAGGVSKSSSHPRRRRKRVVRRNLGMSASGAIKDTTEQTKELKETDPRLPSRPIQNMFHRKGVILHRVKRSSSLPNVLEAAEVFGEQLPSGLGSRGPSPAADGVSLLQRQSRTGASGECSSAGSTPPLTLEGQREHLQHRHHHHRDNNKGGHPRRHSHKPTQQTQPSAPRQNLALSALSDTELEYQTPRTAKASQGAEWSWGWGSLPVKNESMESIADVDQKGQHSRHVSIDIPTAPKPILNEIEIEGETYRVAISLCPGDDFGKDVVASEALFATHQVSFDEFGKDPLKILNNKSLVCLINDRYFTWAAAGPYLASLCLFRKPLSDETLHQLSAKDTRHLSDRSQTQEQPTRFSALSRWLRGSPTANQLSAIEQGQRRRPSGSDETLSTQQPDEEEADEKLKETNPKSEPQLHIGPDNEPMTRSTSMPLQHSKAAGLDDKDSEQAATPEPEHRSMKRYAKTLRLTSDQLKSLNLKKGANTLTFSVTSSYQGKAVCSAKLFLWDHDYQVVISDIDGTITKSDALGHIFTMAGKDWTHTGVAKLYTDISNNGYHILYLTSRAIGQADYTRKYLKNVEQDNYQLPDGPVIMSPDRLMTAFHREVIMRKPEEFKMACLRDIRRLFEDRNPFYAGFGNRITDALSYRSVNVPSSRIFTIDSGGEVKLELLSSYKSSYLALNDLVNEIFPGKIHAPEFNDWNFWKPPMPIIDLPMAPSPQPTLPSNPIIHGSSGTPGRLNVIRSFTSSLTSSGSLKKRPSIPTFSSSPVHTTSPLASSPLSSQPMMASTPTPPPPPSSAPAGLQIADRTRRLSLSLMKYGGSHSASASSTHVATSSSTQITIGQMSSSPPSSSSETVAILHENARSRGMSMTLSSPGYVPSNLGTSPPTTSSTLSEVHPLDIPTVKKASSFSVSPPQLASRLSETVIPFLRGRSSRSEQGQQQPDVDSLVAHHEQILPSTDDYSESNITEYQEGDEYEGYSGDHYDAGEEGGEYEEYEYGDEEEMMEGDLEDDVELNIDAPFL
ncbi:hypothetical protein BGZ95_006539 [Linnemannia exigua]|uniref:phosphatidate phosphatase n=1 Tax=Linnemannia exigua TaxID=604196 RepID=A0AAD4H792_9FUNG|nr:hypothetical protein BGZ95_006539 [Linnemannia exigua]